MDIAEATVLQGIHQKCLKSGSSKLFWRGPDRHYKEIDRIDLDKQRAYFVGAGGYVAFGVTELPRFALISHLK